ncbi:hypothetical protein [Carp edema virus]|nr:hypothetical protein [Carp edema virus]
MEKHLIDLFSIFIKRTFKFIDPQFLIKNQYYQKLTLDKFLNYLKNKNYNETSLEIYQIIFKKFEELEMVKIQEFIYSLPKYISISDADLITYYSIIKLLSDPQTRLLCKQQTISLTTSILTNFVMSKFKIYSHLITEIYQFLNLQQQSNVSMEVHTAGIIKLIYIKSLIMKYVKYKIFPLILHEVITNVEESGITQNNFAQFKLNSYNIIATLTQKYSLDCYESCMDFINMTDSDIDLKKYLLQNWNFAISLKEIAGSEINVAYEIYEIIAGNNKSGASFISDSFSKLGSYIDSSNVFSNVSDVVGGVKTQAEVNNRKTNLETKSDKPVTVVKKVPVSTILKKSRKVKLEPGLSESTKNKLEEEIESEMRRLGYKNSDNASSELFKITQFNNELNELKNQEIRQREMQLRYDLANLEQDTELKLKRKTQSTDIELEKKKFQLEQELKSNRFEIELEKRRLESNKKKLDDINEVEVKKIDLLKVRSLQDTEALKHKLQNEYDMKNLMGHTELEDLRNTRLKTLTEEEIKRERELAQKELDFLKNKTLQEIELEKSKSKIDIIRKEEETLFSLERKRNALLLDSEKFKNKQLVETKLAEIDSLMRIKKEKLIKLEDDLKMDSNFKMYQLKKLEEDMKAKENLKMYQISKLEEDTKNREMSKMYKISKLEEDMKLDDKSRLRDVERTKKDLESEIKVKTAELEKLRKALEIDSKLDTKKKQYELDKFRQDIQSDTKLDTKKRQYDFEKAKQEVEFEARQELKKKEMELLRLKQDLESNYKLDTKKKQYDVDKARQELEIKYDLEKKKLQIQEESKKLDIKKDLIRKELQLEKEKQRFMLEKERENELRKIEKQTFKQPSATPFASPTTHPLNYSPAQLSTFTTLELLHAVKLIASGIGGKINPSKQISLQINTPFKTLYAPDGTVIHGSLK